MKFTEAFEQLGYTLQVPRQDWTAAKSDGVCLSLWKNEMGMQDGMLWMNTRVHADDLQAWQRKAGNTKRISHLKLALSRFNGRVDVVIVSGTPGVGYGTAQPWLAEGARNGTYWEITDFDEQTGHFEVMLRTTL